MTELITLPQANHLMIAILVIAPIIGVVGGYFAKELVRGFIYGVIVGAGNFALWKIYNVITDHLGLDTVKNLVVNIVLFLCIGVAAGFLFGRFGKQRPSDKSTEIVDEEK